MRWGQAWWIRGINEKGKLCTLASPVAGTRADAFITAQRANRKAAYPLANLYLTRAVDAVDGPILLPVA